MKRIISFLLSIVMMFSVFSAVDMSAYANNDKEPEYLTEDDALFFTATFLGKLTKEMKSKYIDLLVGNTDYDCREGLHNETEWTMLQDSVNKVQSKWSKILKYMPKSISDSQLAKLGNSAFKYISSTVDIFKNIDYIINEDENILEQTYHSLDIISDCCSLMGITLGPLGVVISALKGLTATILFLYNALDNSMETIAINGYKSRLGACNLTNEEYPEPPSTYTNLLGYDVESEFVYQECCKVYVRASLKRMAQNMKNDTVIESIYDYGYYGGHSYQVIKNTFSTFDAAEKYCEEKGGHLAVIEDKEEDIMVYNYLRNCGQNSAFLGIHEKEEGIWIDVFGNPINYCNWAPNEPNNAGGINEYIINYWRDYPNGQWNDTYIGEPYCNYFICEWDYYIDSYPMMNDEHHYAQTVVAPTCTTDGYTINKCTDCELEYYSDNVSKLGHNYNFSKTVTSTCTAQGYDMYSCTRCNNTEKRNTISALGHNYQYQRTVAPTCLSQGYDLYKCTRCTSTENRNKISAKGHSCSFTKTVEPTCTSQGYDLYTCSVCNATEKRNTVSSTGHNYEEKSNTATCTDAGVKTTVCSKCGDTKTTDVSALGHSYSKVYTAPTCTKSGGYTNTCSRCGDITYNVYEKYGHDYGNIIGKNYIDKISGSSISAVPKYFNEFYHTSSSIGSASKAAMTSTNIAVPNEIRLDINDMTEVRSYQFAIKGGMLSRKTCTGIFAYDKLTGRTPEQSAIPYTDKNGNLVNMNYIDYKTKNKWICGEYLLNNNQITDITGTVVCTDFKETRPHIVYTREDALEKGIMNVDGTVNISLELVETLGISFSAGIPGVYFIPTHITSSNSRRFFETFGFDDSRQGEIKAGKYNIDICFYNTTTSGLTETTIKIYDNHLISKTPATISTDEKVTYTCMDCGETHTETSSLDLENFKIKTVSASLKSSITMNYKVLKSAVADFKEPFIEFTRNGKSTVVREYIEKGDYYIFEYTDIAPQCMNDTVTAVLHATHNDIDYSSNSLDFSVAKYAYGMLDMYSGDQYAKLRTLLVDLLNYGAESQKYQNYKTDDLVNAKLTETQKSWASAQALNLTNAIDTKYKTVDNPTVEWKSAGLQLNDSVAVRYKFTAKNIDGLQLKVTCGASEWIYTSDDFTYNGDGTYTFLFNDLNADKMQEDIFITAINGDKAVSNTMRYSVESYAKQVQDAMPNSSLRNLTDAMMRYGISASNYA